MGFCFNEVQNAVAFRLFAVESRIRQDVLFSPLAFVLSVELLILVFRENYISLEFASLCQCFLGVFVMPWW